MRTMAILPVKSFAAAKQRLAEGVEPRSRALLARSMFKDVLDALRAVPGLDALLVVTADPMAASLARDARVPVLHDGEQAGQSAAALLGIAHALAAGYERALLVPGDTPLLQPGELARLLERSESVTIVPDRHGTGTNALLLSPPDAIEPSFGPGSFERHLALAERAALAHAVERIPGLVLDVDTADDLERLCSALENAPAGLASATRKALPASS
jgi:2-phospho-L-lactate/phosphoenolpyruvate guanylyltransferase